MWSRAKKLNVGWFYNMTILKKKDGWVKKKPKNKTKKDERMKNTERS